MRNCWLLILALTSGCGEPNLNPKPETINQTTPTKISNKFEKIIQKKIKLFKANQNSEEKIASSDQELAAIKRKYQLLKTVLDSEIAAYRDNLNSQRTKQFQYHSKLMATSDAPYPIPHFSSVYHPKELKEVSRVFNRFGELYVNETRDCHGKIKAVSIQAAKPWSGFWYPFGSNSLYHGDDSPLQKFDRLMQIYGRDSQSASRE